jgi:hypothetical protein
VPHGTYRFHLGNTDIGAMCILGTFAEVALGKEGIPASAEEGAAFDLLLLALGAGAALYARPGAVLAAGAGASW